MAHSKKVLACVAAYNEEKNIGRILLSATPHVDKVVVVDDGSSDVTGQIAEKLGAHVIRHVRNEGKGACLKHGFAWAKRNKYDVVVTIDADGQHNPDDIPNVLRPVLENKADIAIGSRIRRPRTMPRSRRAAQKLIDNIARVEVGGTFVDTQSGFRAYSRKAIDAIEITEPGMGAESELLMKAVRQGLTIVEVPVSMRYGTGYTSKLNPIIHFSDVLSTVVKEITGRRPLRFLGIPGLVLIVYGVYSWLEILASYNVTQEFAVGHALVYTAVLLAGIFITIAAIVLFVIRMMIQEIRAA